VQEALGVDARREELANRVLDRQQLTD
jgi:hypothetical protein